MTRIFFVITSLLTALLALLFINVLLLPNHQLGTVPPALTLPLNPDTTIAHLAGALRLATVSRPEGGRADAQDSAATRRDSAPFRALQGYLERTFPLIHQRLLRQVVNEFGLLYEWPGTDPTLKPLLLLAHQDVVPVLAGTASNWIRAPFAGQVANGFLYGRGALDDKLNLMGEMEAVEYLLRTGYRPRRTVLLAFGQDEEVQGSRGAPALAQLISRRFPGLGMVLDEGGLIKSDGVAGLSQPVALVGVSEKGYLTLELHANGVGGHSSMPSAHTAVGLVAGAVARLEAHPFPGSLAGGAGELLRDLAPAAPLAQRLIFSNQWLFGPLIRHTLEATPSGRATLRTTMAATMFQGGEKDNVLPTQATATINLRLLPGETVDQVKARVEQVIDEPAILVRVVGTGHPASPVSRTDNAAFAALHRTITSVFPRALVAPYVVLGATDARSYASLCPAATYRFMPVMMDQADIERLHGTNERLGVAAYQDVVRFYAALLRTEW